MNFNLKIACKVQTWKKKKFCHNSEMLGYFKPIEN